MKKRIFSLVGVLMLIAMALHATAIPQASQANNVVTVQLAMILDGSGSINSTEWAIMIDGLAAAVENPDCVPQDGSVELTVIQFSTIARLEVGPVVITRVALERITLAKPAISSGVSPFILRAVIKALI